MTVHIQNMIGVKRALECDSEAEAKVETVALSPCIEIEAVYKTKMVPSTVELANEVISKIGDMDPKILPKVGDANTVHACAALGGCPLAQHLSFLKLHSRLGWLRQR